MSYHPYRWCITPECSNTSVKTPGKLWIQLPTDIIMRNTWLKLANRTPSLLSPKSHLYLCEDHFDLENDMENYRQYKIMGSVKKIRMKPNCVPSKFDCHEDRKQKSKQSKYSYLSKKQRKETEEIRSNIAKPLLHSSNQAMKLTSTRCINCTYRLTNYRKHFLSELSNDLLLILQAWIKPTEWSQGDVVCNKCFDLLLNASTSGKPHKPALGHVHICYVCGISLFKSKTYKVSPDCPERNVLLKFVPFHQVSRLKRVCADCWIAATRYVKDNRNRKDQIKKKLIREKLYQQPIDTKMEMDTKIIEDTFVNESAKDTDSEDEISGHLKDVNIEIVNDSGGDSHQNYIKLETADNCDSNDDSVEDTERENEILPHENNIKNYIVRKSVGTEKSQSEDDILLQEKDIKIEVIENPVCDEEPENTVFFGDDSSVNFETKKQIVPHHLDIRVEIVENSMTDVEIVEHCKDIKMEITGDEEAPLPIELDTPQEAAHFDKKIHSKLYKRVADTGDRCVFKNCCNNERLEFPLPLKVSLLERYKIYVPSDAKLCLYHKNNNLWENLTADHNDFTGEQMDEMMGLMELAFQRRREELKYII